MICVCLSADRRSKCQPSWLICSYIRYRRICMRSGPQEHRLCANFGRIWMIPMELLHHHRLVLRYICIYVSYCLKIQAYSLLLLHKYYLTLFTYTTDMLSLYILTWIYDTSLFIIRYSIRTCAQMQCGGQLSVPALNQSEHSTFTRIKKLKTEIHEPEQSERLPSLVLITACCLITGF